MESHMQDLRDVTHEVHYDNYRIDCLSRHQAQSNHAGAETGRKKLSSMRSVRSGHRAWGGIWKTLDATQGSESPADTEYQDPDTIRILQQKDEEIKQMQDLLEQMKQKL